MRKLTIIVAFALGFTGCNSNNSATEQKVPTTKKEVMELSNKEKTVALLKSIEIGAKEPIAYINSNKYIQHNPLAADGLEGFGELLSHLPEGGAKVNTVRVFEDGDYVITHTDYDFFGPKIGFDIFRFEDGLIVEHWDNLQETVIETASGRSMIDGPTEVKDLAKTEENKALIQNLLNDVFYGANPDKITDYISTKQYDQHNPDIKDGLAGLGEALQALPEVGTPMIFEKTHKILGEGNFVLSISEGKFMGEKVSFYDLFRIENGKVVEHWDTIEKFLPEGTAKNDNGKYNFK